MTLIPCRSTRAGRWLALTLSGALALAALPAAAGEHEDAAGALAGVALAFEDHPADAALGEAIRAEPLHPEGAPVTVTVEVLPDADGVRDQAEALRAALRDGLEEAFRDEVARQLEEAAGEPVDPETLDALVEGALAQLDALPDFELDTALDAAVADDAERSLAAEVAGAVLSGVDAATIDVELAVADDAVGLTGTQLEGATIATAPTADGTGAASFDELFAIGRAGRGFTLAASVDETVTVEIAVERDIAPPDLTVIGEACCVPEEGARLTAGAAATRQVDLLATSEPSSRFTIWAVVEDCAPGVPCAAGARGQGFRVDVEAGAEAGALLLSPSHEDPGCAEDYLGLPGAVLFDTAAGAGVKTVTATIDRAVAHEVPDNGRAFYDVCMLGDAPFVAKDGTLVERDDDLARYPGDTLVFGPALLPDCQPRAGGQPPPCVSSRTAGREGTAVIVLRLPEGDPMFR